MMNKIAGCLLITTLLTGCSSYRPEDFESKMARYDAKYQHNRVPEFEIPEINQAMTRSPASVRDTEIDYEDSEFHEFNNKNIYFLSLNNQYEQLRKLISKDSLSIKSCPFFHSGLLSYREKAREDAAQEQVTATALFEYYQKNKVDLTRNPEFLLPVELKEPMPTVTKVLDGQHPEEHKVKAISQALTNHLTKTYNELQELCDTGSSDNYYVFENLMTYTKSTSINPDKEGLRILYRTTLFSNMVLLRSLSTYSKGRAPASAANSQINYEWDVMKRLRVKWMKEFVANFK